MRFFRVLSLTAVMMLCSIPNRSSAQAAALNTLLSNATDINFFWTVAGAPRPDAKPAGKPGAHGLGFELSFLIPRDTTVNAAKRTEPAWRLGIGVGFTQTGAFVSRPGTSDFRVSLREAPSVTAYATHLQDSRILSTMPFDPSLYLGIRTGLITLNAGRAYTSSKTFKFGGETFQLGPVVGFVGEIGHVDIFVEGAYMWRDFKSVEWETSDPLPASLPRRLNLSGSSIAAGIQFSLKPSTGK